jgi:hypothetical protein
MALDPTLCLVVNSALRAGVDGTFDPIVMIIPDKFSQPYEHTAGPQRRAQLINRLQLSGWRAGHADANETPNPHHWGAAWDADRTLRLGHRSTTAPFVCATITNPEDPAHTELWWRVVRSSARILALFITTPRSAPGDNRTLEQELADGRFLYIAMPLSRT